MCIIGVIGNGNIYYNHIILAGDSISVILNAVSCLASLLSQQWRSMIIAPDTKILEWSSGFLFSTMTEGNVLDPSPWYLANTPPGGGGYGEGHVIPNTSWPLAFKPLGEHLSLFDSCIIIIVLEDIT